MTKRLHVMLHGWLDHRGFARNMGRWRRDVVEPNGDALLVPVSDWLSWRRGSFRRLLPQIVRAMRESGADSVLLGGNSDGATWVHQFAWELHGEGIRVTHLIHYGGLWYGNTMPVDRVQACFIAGEADCIPGIWHSPYADTEKAARAYRAPFIQGFGGHRWDVRNHMRIAAQLGLRFGG